MAFVRIVDLTSDYPLFFKWHSFIQIGSKHRHPFFMSRKLSAWNSKITVYIYSDTVHCTLLVLERVLNFSVRKIRIYLPLINQMLKSDTGMNLTNHSNHVTSVLSFPKCTIYQVLLSQIDKF